MGHENKDELTPERRKRMRREWRVQRAWADDPRCPAREREEILAVIASEKARWGE